MKLSVYFAHGYKMMMTAWAWHYQYGCHAYFTEESSTFKHVKKNLTKNQNYS